MIACSNQSEKGEKRRSTGRESFPLAGASEAIDEISFVKDFNSWMVLAFPR
jgi:hypothetical protein